MSVKKIPPARVLFESDHQQLTFQPPQLSQAEAFSAAIAESLETLKVFMLWSHEPQTVERQRARLADSLGSYWSGTDHVFAVFNAECELVMAAGMHARIPLNPNATEIGYWVRRSYQGQGLATLATQVLTLLGISWFGYDRIQISHNVANVASGRVIEKVGFRYEGIIRNNEAPRSEEHLQQGLSPSRDAKSYAILPEDLDDLPWVKEVRPGVCIVDYKGQLHRI